MPTYTPEEIAKMRKLLKKCQAMIPKIREPVKQEEKEKLEKVEAKEQKNVESKQSKVQQKAKDDSEVLETKHKKMNADIAPAIEKFKKQEQKRAKDDTEKDWLIDVYVDGEYAGNFDYFGKLKNDLVLSYVKEKVWTKDIVSVLGNLENFDMRIDEAGE